MKKTTARIASAHKLRILVAAQVLWVGLVCVLGAWWAKLALKQAGKIEELELAAGVATGEVHRHWERTQRMLYWESSTFFGLVLITAVFLFWIYWNEMRRARSIQAFFASVTHELRTPLTSVRLQAESIADAFPGDSSQRALVDRLMEDTQRLESQVERTLELARLEGGGPVFLQAVELKPWLERLTQSWTEMSSNQGAKAAISLKLGEYSIEADPAALQVIFRNLLENSVKHSKKEKVGILISARKEYGKILVRFQDDGNGYDGAGEGLGELFHRGASSLGSGVGLYLVVALMRRMGGETKFGVSQSGKGFSVELQFPRESDHD